MGSILHQTTVIRDGMHNAFTDLQYWQGAYWASYRKGAGHISRDAHAVVAVSHDRFRFTELAKSRVKGDVRDPKLLPINEDQMALYYPSWLEGAGKVERNGKTYYKPLQQFVCFSSNGCDWDKPQPILAPNMWLWRVRKHDGRYFGLIQNIAGAHEDGSHHQLDLAVSDDLLHWETIARVGDGLNESDILWRPDGEAWIVARTIKGKFSVFASAQSPYTDWQTVDMGPMVHAPIMIEHEGDVFVAGRSRSETEGITDAPFNGNSQSVWRVTPGKLESVLRVPVTGDCSYPGLIKDPQSRICMTYYSQHAYHMGIFPTPTARTHSEDKNSASDVFFAEIELP